VRSHLLVSKIEAVRRLEPLGTYSARRGPKVGVAPSGRCFESHELLEAHSRGYLIGLSDALKG
jgi:hypothetical protein